MGLIGLLRLLYRYGPPTPGSGPSVSPITKGTLDYAIKHLLTQTGGGWTNGATIRICVPVPETENHIWMTESSRWLSNQLIRAQLNFRIGGQCVQVHQKSLEKRLLQKWTMRAQWLSSSKATMAGFVLPETKIRLVILRCASTNSA